jgi:uncharacterized membrane protein
LSGLFEATIVFLTILSVVAIGIFAAYAVVNGILLAFAQHRREKRGTPVLVPSQTHASGD